MCKWNSQDSSVSCCHCLNTFTPNGKAFSVNNNTTSTPIVSERTDICNLDQCDDADTDVDMDEDCEEWKEDGQKEMEGTTLRVPPPSSKYSSKGHHHHAVSIPPHQCEENGLDRLYNICNDSFQTERDANGNTILRTLTLDQIKCVSRGMMHLQASTLGVGADTMSSLKNIETCSRFSNTISYTQLFETNRFSVGIFCLTPGSVIPLHDHPDMTCFSRILHGSAKLQAFDRVGGKAKAEAEGDEVYTRAVTNAVVNSSTVRVLFPSMGGNIHSIVADEEEGCIMLDVQALPYNDTEGRPCTYFEHTGRTKQAEDGDGNGTSTTSFTVLRRVMQPAGMRVENLPYMGEPCARGGLYPADHMLGSHLYW